MNNANMERLQREIQELGIINVEASGGLTPDFLAEAVQAVKETNLDFDELALQMKQERKQAT